MLTVREQLDLLSTMKQIRQENEQLIEFARNIIQIAFDGGNLDGGDIQEMGVNHGLLTEEKYDPDKHGSDFGFDFSPGDTIYMYSENLNKSGLPQATDSTEYAKPARP